MGKPADQENNTTGPPVVKHSCRCVGGWHTFNSVYFELVYQNPIGDHISGKLCIIQDFRSQQRNTHIDKGAYRPGVQLSYTLITRGGHRDRERERPAGAHPSHRVVDQRASVSSAGGGQLTQPGRGGCPLMPPTTSPGYLSVSPEPVGG